MWLSQSKTGKLFFRPLAVYVIVSSIVAGKTIYFGHAHLSHDQTSLYPDLQEIVKIESGCQDCQFLVLVSREPFPD